MPKKGETVTIDDFEFKIISADKRRIQLLQLSIPKDYRVNGKIAD
jgi:magnesium and cobalt transporter